jgi:hypothetical protein
MRRMMEVSGEASSRVGAIGRLAHCASRFDTAHDFGRTLEALRPQSSANNKSTVDSACRHGCVYPDILLRRDFTAHSQPDTAARACVRHSSFYLNGAKFARCSVVGSRPANHSSRLRYLALTLTTMPHEFVVLISDVDPGCIGIAMHMLRQSTV